MSVLQNGLFGCLVTHRPGKQLGYNGLQNANDSFLKAIVRHSQFTELHLFLMPAEIEGFRSAWQPHFDAYGSDKVIRLISVHQLPDYFSQCFYAVFHCGDPYISDLVALRDHHAPKCFPVVGRAHTMSDDPGLSRIKDLVMSPVKSCDAILCSSVSQRQVVKRLLSTASASISDSLGIALPYRGRLEQQGLGLEVDSECQESKDAVRKSLNLPDDKKILLCLGRLSPFDKMDIHPLLLALNELVEAWRIDDFLLVIAGSGDAGGPYVQSLLKRAYELNLEDHLRFELSIDESKKHQLYKAADVFVSLADNVQESFGITPLEAMRDEVPVVLSDWNGYRELVENEVNGYLIPTMGVNNEAVNRSLSLLHAPQARLIEAQSVSVDIEALVNVLAGLLTDDGLRQQAGKAGRRHFVEQFAWPGLIDAYQQMAVALGKEAASVAYRQGRPAGLAFHNVFGHYPSEQLELSRNLVTTDRGLRVLIQSEHGFHFSELKGWLDQDVIYQLLEQCIQSRTVASLEALHEGQSIRFTLAWMLKYQLLKLSEAGSESASFVKMIHSDDSGDDYKLTFPEQRRAHLLQPFLASGMAVLSKAVAPFNEHKPLLLLALGNELVSILDGALLQAIGWFAREQKMTAYSEVLEALEQAGGVEFLARSWPYWYRSHRVLVFRYLRSVRCLLRRVQQDMESIQSTYGEVWGSQAGALAGVDFFSHHREYSVFLLTFDNGQKLVYKARDMRVDHALTDPDGQVVKQVNQWLIQVQSQVQIGTHQLLCRQESVADRQVHYGYAEFLDYDESGLTLSTDEARNYYRQTGGLLAYVLLLGVADLHQQNLISRNGMIYLIDPKTAFHRGCYHRLLNELKQPETAFLRGFDGSSLEVTGLNHLWQDFHIARLASCSVKLVNGELLEVEPQQFKPVLMHLLTIEGQNSLDCNPMPRFAEDILAGFAEVIAAMAEHSDECKALLSGLEGYQIRYQPFMNLNEAKKLLCDIQTASALQSLDNKRIDAFVHRLTRRMTLAGEVSQRWVEPEWQEAVTLLDDSLAESILGLELPIYTSLMGGRELSVRLYDGFTESVAGEYFNTDVMDSVRELLDGLKDEAVRHRFVEAYVGMLDVWFTQQLVPGWNMPEDVRQAIRESLSG
ncbi:glycosyltransferase [Endozoicomonas lisbonensis]|uniref:Glycosyltransferase involved in cell wall biosynthesis n=1 Tax=Endozoicomonas lisbonensis TaxID=3120522 RepID=A0ABV2SC32_9GAMM